MDIFLCNIKFHFHFSSVLSPSVKYSNDLPHPGYLLLSINI